MTSPKRQRKSSRQAVSKVAPLLEKTTTSRCCFDPYGAISEPVTTCPAGDHKKKKNCVNNPWCLLDLLDEKKGIWKPNPTCMLKLGYDPAFSRRDLQGKSNKLTPSGIRNLGATCYLNVLIQMLHQNLLIRDAIFNMQTGSDRSRSGLMDSLNSPSDINKFEGNAHMAMVVGALQDTFGHLTSCVKGDYDISLFVDLLELNKSEQQDPQEFSKLLFAKLEESQLPLKNAALPNIKQLISGKEIYSTTCTVCGAVSSQSNEFREIGLNIEGCASLLQAIDGYQKVEMLEGENQFSCSSCQRKTDATRCVKISDTPAFLILKLMRYYYDRKTSEKKKAQVRSTIEEHSPHDT